MNGSSRIVNNRLKQQVKTKGMTHSTLKKICASVLEVGFYLGELHMKPVYLPTILLGFVLAAPSSFAGSATWKYFHFPFSNGWNLANNWSPETVPNSLFDTATFQTSLTPNVSISDNIEVDKIVFNSNGLSEPTSFTIAVNAGASFAIDNHITNDSGVIQNFVTAAGGFITFDGGVGVVGSGIVFTNAGGIEFDVSTGAGNAAFHNTGGYTRQSKRWRTSGFLRSG